MAQRLTTGPATLTAKFTELNNLSRGASILFATDDFFAAAENLLKDTDAEWQEGVFDPQGKWMDGWETRRKRISGHDWCIIKLPYASVIHGIDADTSYFTGNFTPKISIQAARLSPKEESMIPPRQGGTNMAATEDELKQIARIRSDEWKSLTPITKLGAGYSDTCHNLISIDNRDPWTHIRLNYYPDGGVARLRIFGQVQRTWEEIKNSESPNGPGGTWDLIAVENGGICVALSNAHYGHPRNMILKHPAPNIGNGWETARRLDRPDVITVGKNGMSEAPGNEWAVFRLGLPGKVMKVEVDTSCFKGNYPASCKIEGCYLSSFGLEEQLKSDKDQGLWKTIVPLSKLGPDAKHILSVEKDAAVLTHIRITMAPDGGIARFRAWGNPTSS